MVFATNITRHICLKYFDMIPDEYKARWEIETWFRCVVEAQGMTRSHYLVVRLALFFFALLFYNAWTISRFLETDGGDPGLWPRCITLEQFSSSVMSLLRPSCAPPSRCLMAAAANIPEATSLNIPAPRQEPCACASRVGIPAAISGQI